MTQETSWRDLAIHSISCALSEYNGPRSVNHSMDWKHIRKFVNDRYPFGVRKYTPYTIWCQELKRVEMFLKTGWELKAYSGWINMQASSQRKASSIKPVEGQTSLFDI